MVGDKRTGQTKQFIVYLQKYLLLASRISCHQANSYQQPEIQTKLIQKEFQQELCNLCGTLSYFCNCTYLKKVMNDNPLLLIGQLQIMNNVSLVLIGQLQPLYGFLLLIIG